MAKLFKGKRQEVENGNKTSSAANPKAKVNVLDIYFVEEINLPSYIILILYKNVISNIKNFFIFQSKTCTVL